MFGLKILGVERKNVFSTKNKKLEEYISFFIPIFIYEGVLYLREDNKTWNNHKLDAVLFR